MSLGKQTARILRGVARRLDPPVEPAARPVSAADLAPLPESGPSVPGSRKASMFFDAHPRFYDTSETAAGRGRLNLRHEGIFAENRDILDGARVLDIASHDGRWSLAALDRGAASVVGIEARPDLVAHANANLEHYGYSSDRFRFVVGDVHDVLNSADLDVDVVLCLGFLYHTLRYNDLFRGIRRTGARHLVVDTEAPAMMRPQALIRVFGEPSGKQSAAAADDFTFGASVLTGPPQPRGHPHHARLLRLPGRAALRLGGSPPRQPPAQRRHGLREAVPGHAPVRGQRRGTARKLRAPPPSSAR